MDVSTPDERSERDEVLVTVAAMGHGTATDVGARTGHPVTDIRDHLDSLAHDQMVRRSGEDRWEIAPVDGARQEHWVADLRRRFAGENEAPADHRRLLSAGPPPPRPGIWTYVGARASLAVHYQLLEQATENIRALDRPPYIGGLPLPADDAPDSPEMRAVARGVGMKAIYSEGFRHLARLWHLRRAVQSGAQVRIGPAPIKVQVIDERVAYIPTLKSYEVPDHMTAVVVWDPALVQVLLELFEQSWDGARAIPMALGSPDDVRQRELITMLLAGCTDSVIARTLEVTERTVRRWVHDLLTVTGSETRLQLGAALVAYRDTQDNGVR